MTTLQIVMLGVWLVIIFGVISAEGWKNGVFLCFVFTIQFGFFAALAALVYYSLVAVSQVFV